MQVWQICLNFFTKRPRSFHQTPEKFTKGNGSKKTPFHKTFFKTSEKQFCWARRNVFAKSLKISRWKPKVITKTVYTFKNYPPSRSYSGDVGFDFDNTTEKFRRRNEICRQGCQNNCSKNFSVVLKILSFSCGVAVDN